MHIILCIKTFREVSINSTSRGERGYPGANRRSHSVSSIGGWVGSCANPQRSPSAKVVWGFVRGLTRDRGTLVCTGPASIIDGQHRIEGIKRFLDEYSTEVRIPFCAIHNLDENEEIETFLIVNTTAKPIQKSHVHYLERDRDPISWVATQLATDPRSPFYGITAITGVRQWRRGLPVTLQNLVKMVTVLYRKVDAKKVPKEAMLEIALTYFSEIKNTFPEAWEDVKHHGMMQIAVLNALAMVAAQMIDTSQGEAATDLYALKQSVANMKGFDWSRERFKGISGPKGSETIQVELLTHMAKQSARRGTE
ncbi:DGQHR domain-containing protein [Alicyclobacillaceae bacterium I2511]|nr:DGQHR domain-containing protein [Alicyclobacillaceae bacterium I2511]